MRYEQETSGFNRPLSFLDAVYGFALTLLVTTIDVDGRAAWESVGALLSEDGTELLSFVISFVVIVVFWRQNHALVAQFEALDSATIVANIVVVGLVIFIPFTTEAMGDPQLQDLALPTALYALNVALAVLASIVMYQIAARHGLIAEPETPAVRRARLLDAFATPVVFLVSIPVTYLGVAQWGDSSAGKYVWLSLVVIAPLSGRHAARVSQRERRPARPGRD
jgi:uncharacterized membrane protein